MLRGAAVAVVVLGLAGLPSAAAQPARQDYAAIALNVLPPGENGSLTFNRNTRDQARLYDCLTPLFDRVRAADLGRCFKRAPLGLVGKAVRVQRPRPGVVIERDRWGVPYITGKTAADVAFGAGWVTVEDRGLLLELIRGPARAAALDIPGISPVELALSGQTLLPSAQGEARLEQQVELLRKSGPKGRAMLSSIRAYASGLNAGYRRQGTLVTPYTAKDAVAVGALLAARFGANGGSEVQRSMFLDALQQKLGAVRGRAVFDDLRDADNSESPVIAPGRFPYNVPPASAAGSVTIDDGSFVSLGPEGRMSALERRPASNALLIGAKRSTTGHPVLVGGPQVGYFFPQFFMEVQLAGGGYNVRGALLPGLPLVLVGRGPDFAWTVTSSQSDNVDAFAETLCGDDRHYTYKGVCREMTTVDAGTLRVPGAPDQRVTLLQTAHGVVQGYATVGGRRVAIAHQRSTRNREVLSAVGIYDLNTRQVTSARSFVNTVSRVDAMFNFFYADDRDIAYVTTGRLPVRAPGTDPSLPTVGTGEYDWRGFLAAKAHPQTINPPSGAILDWNSKPAAGWGAADDNWSYGSVQRKELLSAALGSGKRTAAQLVAAANKAATQDLRVLQVWPLIAEVLMTAPTPNLRVRTAADMLRAWGALGGSRLDRDLDGKIDHAGAAIMDVAWPRFARAVMRPVLGDLVEPLARLHTVSNDASPQGSAYQDGWYGYVEKDLRRLLRLTVRDPYKTQFCGAGNLESCRESLWRALEQACDILQAKQGVDPTTWRGDARPERITFTTGLIPDTMAWTNRPTFQQVMSFSAHRPR